MASVDGFWGTHQLCEPGEGNGLGLLSPMARSEDHTKSSSPSFLTEISFSRQQSEQHRVFSVFAFWFLVGFSLVLVFFFFLWGSYCLSVTVPNCSRFYLCSFSVTCF